MRTRALSRLNRFSFFAPRRMITAALAATPAHIAFIFGLTNRIISKIAKPASASPPGELIYILISSLFSASRSKSCVMICCAIFFVTSSVTITVRVFNNFEIRSPPGCFSFSSPAPSFCFSTNGISKIMNRLQIKKIHLIF